MAITYSAIAYRGKAAEPIIEELLFENKTVSEDLVSFEDDVKAETIFTEVTATAVMQPWTCGEPTAAGDMSAFDTVVTPVKYMYFDTYCPDTLRFSRFKTSMKPGAWNDISEEFERVVIGGVYAKKISLDIESKFWSNVLPATKVAVAALTAGATNAEVSAQEKALVAATPSTAPFGLWDGIVQKMIYNSSNPAGTAGVGGRLKVVGTTVTSSNIKTEYDKVYAGIAPEVLDEGVNPAGAYIYAPRSHKQMITIFNNNTAAYKDAFIVTGDKITYNGVEIKFVPLPENVMIVAVKTHLVWATDLKSDMNLVETGKVSNTSSMWFLKVVATLQTHIANQRFNTLYVG